MGELATYIDAETIRLTVAQGGRQYAWSSAPVISTLVIGAAILVALGFWEAYAGLKYPILPPKLFGKIREFTMILVGESPSC